MLPHRTPQLVQVVDISIPELELIRNAHLATFGGEACNALKHLLAKCRRKLSLETRATLRASEAFTAAEYVQAQQVRRGPVESDGVGPGSLCDSLRAGYLKACQAVLPAEYAQAQQLDKGAGHGSGNQKEASPVPDCVLQVASAGTAALREV